MSFEICEPTRNRRVFFSPVKLILMPQNWLRDAKCEKRRGGPLKVLRRIAGMARVHHEVQSNTTGPVGKGRVVTSDKSAQSEIFLILFPCSPMISRSPNIGFSIDEKARSLHTAVRAGFHGLALGLKKLLPIQGTKGGNQLGFCTRNQLFGLAQPWPMIKTGRND